MTKLQERIKSYCTNLTEFEQDNSKDLYRKAGMWDDEAKKWYICKLTKKRCIARRIKEKGFGFSPYIISRRMETCPGKDKNTKDPKILVEIYKILVEKNTY